MLRLGGFLRSGGGSVVGFGTVLRTLRGRRPIAVPTHGHIGIPDATTHSLSTSSSSTTSSSSRQSLALRYRQHLDPVGLISPKGRNATATFHRSLSSVRSISARPDVRCAGCGGMIQGDDPGAPGYLPQRVIDRSPLATGITSIGGQGLGGNTGNNNANINTTDSDTVSRSANAGTQGQGQIPPTSKSSRLAAIRREDELRVTRALAAGGGAGKGIVDDKAAAAENEDTDAAVPPNDKGEEDTLEARLAAFDAIEALASTGAAVVPKRRPRGDSRSFDPQSSDPQAIPVGGGGGGGGGLVCLRCHRLRHHAGARSPIDGSADPLCPDAVSAADVRAALGELVDDRAVVVEVVDAWDINATAMGSLIHDLVPNLSSTADKSGAVPDDEEANLSRRGKIAERKARTSPKRLDIIIAVNKADVLPRDVSYQRLEQWVRMLPQYRKQSGSIRAVHFVSARRKTGLAALARSIDSWRRGSNVYIVGCTNTGKSTLVNALQHAFGGSRGRLTTAGVVRTRPSDDEASPVSIEATDAPIDDGVSFERDTPSGAPLELTTSHVPGTTAHVVSVPVLSVPVGSRAVLHDTPGVSTYGARITDHLSSNDVLATMAGGVRLPTGRSTGKLSNIAKPNIYRVVPGSVLEIAGLARIEIQQCASMLVCAFFGAGLPIKACKSKRDSHLQQGAQRKEDAPRAEREETGGRTDEEGQQQGSGSPPSPTLSVSPTVSSMSATVPLMATPSTPAWKWKGPPSDETSLTRLPPFEDHVVEFTGRESVSGRRGTAFADIAIAGLGWISLTCRPEMRKLGAPPPVRVKVTVPEGVEVIARDPLLPYEAVMGKGRAGRKIIKI